MAGQPHIILHVIMFNQFIHPALSTFLAQAQSIHPDPTPTQIQSNHNPMLSKTSLYHGVLGNSMHKGGPHRSKTPDVENEQLQDAIHRYIQKEGVAAAFAFGPYHGIPKTAAVNGPALASLRNFISILAGVEPSLMFKYSQLKAIIQDSLRRFPDIRSRWALHQHESLPGDLADSIMTVCTHVRRLQSEKRFKEACSKCTNMEIEDLATFRDYVMEDGDQMDAMACSSNAGSMLPLACKSMEELPNTQDILEQTLPGTPNSVKDDAAKEGSAKDDAARNDASNKSPVNGDAAKEGSVKDDPLKEADLLQEAMAESPIPSRKQAIREVMKRPACLKRPASPSTPQHTSQSTAQSIPISYADANLHIMKYVKTGAAAVRVRNGKQLFQINIKGNTVEDNAKVAGEFMAKLKKGIPLEQVLEAKSKMMAK